MHFPENQLGQYSSHVGNGMFLLSYPKAMDDGDAEFVISGLEQAVRIIKRRQRQQAESEALSFSWAGVAVTG